MGFIFGALPIVMLEESDRIRGSMGLDMVGTWEAVMNVVRVVTGTTHNKPTFPVLFKV
jgi:hypothetical protein